jgi:hypothetical protein
MSQHQHSAATEVIDPMCGMTINPDDAVRATSITAGRRTSSAASRSASTFARTQRNSSGRSEAPGSSADMTNCSGALQDQAAEKLVILAIWVARRLSALVLALAIVGAPVAASVCQATCASHDMGVMVAHTEHQSAAARHTHHHHSTNPPASFTAAVWVGLPHACEHEADFIVAVHQTLQLLTAPALASPAFMSIPPSSKPTLAGTPFDIAHSPPGALALTTQLRV